MISGTEIGAKFVAALQASPYTFKRWLATPRHPDAIGALIQQTLQLESKPTREELRAMAEGLDRSIDAILEAAYHSNEDSAVETASELHPVDGAAFKVGSTGLIFMQHGDASELHPVDGAELQPGGTGIIFMQHGDASELHPVDGAVLKPGSNFGAFGMHHYDVAEKTA